MQLKHMMSSQKSMFTYGGQSLCELISKQEQEASLFPEGDI